MQNKKSLLLGLTVVLGLVCFNVSTSYAAAGENHGPWGIGLRGGTSVQVQNLYTLGGGVEVQGRLGPIAELEGQYDLSKHFTVGLGAEWEYHNVVASASGVAVTLGNVRTISIMPYARYQFIMGAIHPYFNVAVGYNINQFNISSTIGGVSTAGVNTTLKNSIAVKPGLGVDIFATDHFAVNGEVAWKWNSATLNTNIPTLGISASQTANLSAIELLVGARYFF